MDFEIRAATTDDKPAMWEIQRIVLPNDRSHYPENAGRQGSLCFVAIRQGRIVGFTTGLISESDRAGTAFWERVRPYIGSLVVLPEHQGTGVGTKLLATICDAIFRAPWYREILLECTPDKVGFYEKRGFEVVDPSEVERIWGHGLAMRNPMRMRRSSE